MKLASFGMSDIGVSRSNNEDVWVCLPELGFFALADGMGGHNAGEIAATETIEYLSHLIPSLQTKDPLDQMFLLKEAIEKTNERVFLLSRKEEFFNGMGTTLCCLLWLEDALIYAHIGDSRIYRFREGKLTLLTQDHSLFTKWLRVSKNSKTPYPYKNVITRAVGTSSQANPEIAICRHSPGDLYLLCSDGLSDALSTEEIEKVLLGFENLETISKSLIEEAKFKGSCDNITILLIKDDEKASLSRQQLHHEDRPEGLGSYASRAQWASSESL